MSKGLDLFKEEEVLEYTGVLTVVDATKYGVDRFLQAVARHDNQGNSEFFQMTLSAAGGFDQNTTATVTKLFSKDDTFGKLIIKKFTDDATAGLDEKNADNGGSLFNSITGQFMGSLRGRHLSLPMSPVPNLKFMVTPKPIQGRPVIQPFVKSTERVFLFERESIEDAVDALQGRVLRRTDRYKPHMLNGKEIGEGGLNKALEDAQIDNATNE